MKPKSIFISLGIETLIRGVGTLRGSLSEFIYPSLNYIKILYYSKYQENELKYKNGVEINLEYFKTLMDEAINLLKPNGFKSFPLKIEENYSESQKVCVWGYKNVPEYFKKVISLQSYTTCVPSCKFFYC
jgi:hypothetical protein